MSKNRNRFLVIIPARSGSKGIKNKNIKDINGKPLIQYTIEPALKLLKNKIVEKVIVSTDSQKYKKIAQNLGVEVPFLRPKEISGDTAKSVNFILHAIEFFKKKGLIFDAIIILQPTAPLRTFEDIINSIKIFNSADKPKSLITCYKEDNINDLLMYKKKNNYAIPLNTNHNKGVRRQEHEHFYVRNGAVYITSVEYLNEKSNVISDNPLMYEIPKSRAFDVDTEEDLKIIRKLIY